MQRCTVFRPTSFLCATVASTSYLSNSNNTSGSSSSSSISNARAEMRRSSYRRLPALRRTRSWRGIIQVRFNDSRADRNRILRHAAIWAPIRIFGLGFLTTVAIYFIMGHDFFMHSLLGYESEMQYEARVNPSLNNVYGTLLDKDRSWRSPLRQLEQPLHPKRDLDVFLEEGVSKRA